MLFVLSIAYIFISLRIKYESTTFNAAAAVFSVIRTAANRFFARKPTHYYRRSAANARFDFYRLRGTIHGAGAAFHTRIPVGDICLVVDYIKNSMRANLRAFTASDAFFGVKIKRRHIFKIF
jgi:hypothetical protein